MFKFQLDELNKIVSQIDSDKIKNKTLLRLLICECQKFTNCGEFFLDFTQQARRSKTSAAQWLATAMRQQTHLFLINIDLRSLITPQKTSDIFKQFQTYTNRFTYYLAYKLIELSGNEKLFLTLLETLLKTMEQHQTKHPIDNHSLILLKSLFSLGAFSRVVNVKIIKKPKLEQKLRVVNAKLSENSNFVFFRQNGGFVTPFLIGKDILFAKEAKNILVIQKILLQIIKSQRESLESFLPVQDNGANLMSIMQEQNNQYNNTELNKISYQKLPVNINLNDRIEKSIFNLYNNIENYQNVTITNKKGKLIAQEEWIPNLLNWFKLEIDSIKSSNQKNLFDLFKQCIERIAQNTGKDLDSFKKDFDDLELELKLVKAGKSSSLPTIQTTEAESSVSSRLFLSNKY